MAMTLQEQLMVAGKDMQIVKLQAALLEKEHTMVQQRIAMLQQEMKKEEEAAAAAAAAAKEVPIEKGKMEAISEGSEK